VRLHRARRRGKTMPERACFAARSGRLQKT
jgi:hypothetical protein